MENTIYKIALAAFFHDIGKFAERAYATTEPTAELKAAFYPDEKFLNDNMDLYQPHHNGNYTHKHAVYTAAFIDHFERVLPGQFNRGEWGLGDSFINLSAGHHKPATPMQWVIAIADRVSSGFERNEFEDYNKGIGVQDYKKTRLLTIFEGIATDGESREENIHSYQYRYPLKELSPDNIFPVNGEEYCLMDSEEASREYQNLFFNFIDALDRLNHKNNIPLWFEHFDSLFMIYASHIPAATVGKVIPDISLYDHSKTTAALASAIYLYHMQNNIMEIDRIKDYEDKKFLIVTGDFYGIQNFIFAEGGSTNKAAAKLLRGRSFAVSLITELAAYLLCREIGLTTASIILNAAGKFTIIAPNTDMTRTKIREAEVKINGWLVRMFYGESAIGISSIEASSNDFVSNRFVSLWESLAKVSEKRKYCKVDLERYGGVVEGFLDLFNNELNNKLCPFCGKRPSSPAVEDDPFLGDERSACRICRDHIYIGTNLVRSSRLAVTTIDADIEGDKLCEPIFGEYQVSLDVSGRLSQLANSGALLKYWDILISESGTITKDITAKFINGYVPTYREEDNQDERLLAGRKREETKLELIEALQPEKAVPKTFLHIAKKSLNNLRDKPGRFFGIEALGILKADVDNLGLIFTCGLRRLNLSRLATLSRQMNYFFSIYLPFILSTREGFRDIYTVFAGGDDLFLIGPWNRIIEFAHFLRTEFNRYACGNRQITLSAGISLNKPGEPVLSLSERAEEALKRSKKKKDKNSVTLFEESVKWSDSEQLSKIRDTIEGWLVKSIINNAMLFRFNTFSIMAKREKELIESETIEAEDWEYLKWKAMFRYTIIRNVGRKLKGEEREQAINEVNSKGAEWLMMYGGAMKIPVWQIIYNQR